MIAQEREEGFPEANLPVGVDIVVKIFELSIVADV